MRIASATCEVGVIRRPTASCPRSFVLASLCTQSRAACLYGGISRAIGRILCCFVCVLCGVSLAVVPFVSLVCTAVLGPGSDLEAPNNLQTIIM